MDVEVRIVLIFGLFVVELIFVKVLDIVIMLGKWVKRK